MTKDEVRTLIAYHQRYLPAWYRDQEIATAPPRWFYVSKKYEEILDMFGFYSSGKDTEVIDAQVLDFLKAALEVAE